MSSVSSHLVDLAKKHNTLADLSTDEGVGIYRILLPQRDLGNLHILVKASATCRGRRQPYDELSQHEPLRSDSFDEPDQ